MQPLYTVHGRHQLYHIPTGKLITRHEKLHVIPTPQHIINKINALGKTQNGSILKIESKYFPTCSAAVDNDGEREPDNDEGPETETPGTYDSKENDSDSDSEDDDNDTLDTDDRTVPEESDTSDDSQQDDYIEEDQALVMGPQLEVHPEAQTESTPALEAEAVDAPEHTQVQEQPSLDQDNLEELTEDHQKTLEGRVDEIDDKGRQVKRSPRLKGQQFVQVDVNHDKVVMFTRLHLKEGLCVVAQN